MKNYTAFILSIAIVIALAIGFSSCKEDEPPTPPKLSFAESSMTVNEDDGVIEVELVLDKAYGKDLTIEYDLDGTALDQDAVGSATADYEVQGDHGVVVIESGETSGIIELEIINDVGFEEDETIQISITDTNTSDIELTSDDEIEITITNDDEKLIATMASATLTVNEADGGDGFIEIQVNLDKPAPADITINYTLEGSALDSTFAFEQQPPIPASYYDYYINGVAGELVIDEGATSGVIEIRVYTDFRFENDETIEITLTGPSSGIQIGTNKKMTVTLEQQNGKIIALVWDDAHADVDMDLFLWFGTDIDNLEGVLATAANGAVTPRQELIIFPAILMADPDLDDFAFGLSYNYYSGTANPMNFEVQFADFTDGVLEDLANRDVFAASYTLANLNKWDTPAGISPPIAQTFMLVGGDFADISDPITVATSGSRMKTYKLPKGITKGTFGFSKPL